MKILIYGENWEGTHANIIQKMLREKGIENSLFDFFEILSYHTPIDLANRVLRKLLYRLNEKQINKKLLERINSFAPDVLLIAKGVNIYPETLQECKRRSIVIANWNMDDFFNPLNNSKHMLDSLGIYDFVFSPRPQMFDQYRAAGMKNIIFSESYYVPWLHKKPEPLPPLERKICFVGSHSPRRDEIIGSIDTGFPVEIWGAGWQRSTLRSKKNVEIKDKVMKQADFPQLIAKNLVNLNTLTLENNDLTNLKVFEITACYGLLLTEYNDYTKSFLHDGTFYYDKNDPAGMNKTLAHIFDVNNEEQIEFTRAQGHKLIVNGHNTINDRLDQVLDVVSAALK